MFKIKAIAVSIIIIILVISSLAVLYFQQIDVETDGALSVSELLEDPIYDTELRVYGKVSLLGELFCPCFQLTSKGQKVMVWYDLMIEDDGTEHSPVNVDGINNGDMVIVTGKLKSEGSHRSLNDFWANRIEKISHD
jgi:hypothetical protein